MTWLGLIVAGTGTLSGCRGGGAASDGSSSDVAQNDGVQADSAPPADTALPDTPAADLAQPDAAPPDGSQPDEAQPDTGQSAAVLGASSASADFGNVVVGHTSNLLSFRITNSGQQTSGVLTVSTASAELSIVTGAADDCVSGTTTLAGGASCAVRVIFIPAAVGARAGAVVFSAAPGGTSAVAFTGTGILPGDLSLSPAQVAFGNTPIGTPVTKTVVVTNAGGTAVSGLAVSITGTGNAQFSQITGLGTDCPIAGTLAGGSSCDVRIQFAATARGTFAATLTVSATGQTSPSASLSGTAQQPATLGGSPATLSFGDQEVGTSSAALTWTITNNGDLPTAAAPSFTNSNATDFLATNSCTSVLAGGASCTVSVTFKPGTGGARSGTLTMTSGTSTVTAALSGRGLYRLTVNRDLAGGTCSTCAVKSTEATPLINCNSASCSALYAPAASVTLQARTTNGSGRFFSGWTATGNVCSGPGRDCTFTVNASLSVTATFTALNNNLIFHSSQTVSTAQGSATAYDAFCNSAATAAGINNSAGNAFIAWVSDASSNARTRLTAGNPTVQNWVRMDGRAFSGTLTDLLTNQMVWNPAHFDETGARRAALVMTGTNYDGTTKAGDTNNCQNWTVSTGIGYSGGYSDAGPEAWGDSSSTACTTTARVLCMMRTSSSTMNVATFSGKRIWVSATQYAPAAGANPDTHCMNNRPVGVTTAKALIARTTASADTLLGATQVYIRPDGQRVGTGADIVAGTLDSGVWQLSNAAYNPPYGARVWSGSTKLTTVGTTAGTCGDWLDSTGTAGVVGCYLYEHNLFSFTTIACSSTGSQQGHLYCFEP